MADPWHSLAALEHTVVLGSFAGQRVSHFPAPHAVLGNLATRNVSMPYGDIFCFDQSVLLSLVRHFVLDTRTTERPSHSTLHQELLRSDRRSPITTSWARVNRRCTIRGPAEPRRVLEEKSTFTTQNRRFRYMGVSQQNRISEISAPSAHFLTPRPERWS